MGHTGHGVCIPLLAGTLVVLSAVFITALLEEASALTPRGPIYIDGNADFTPANGVTGGSGAPDDPYIIEGWKLNASTVNGVEIRNTDASFVIRNLTVTSGGATIGIYLFNVTNGRVENVTITDVGDILSFSSGIRAEASQSLALQASNISNAQRGLHVLSSREIAVTGNHLHDNGAGSYVEFSDNVTVEDNLAADNMRGIQAWDSTNLTLRRNNASSNTGWGIDLLRVTQVLLERNEAHANGRDAIAASGVAAAALISNNVSLNQGRGIYAVGADGILVQGNNASSNDDWGITLDSPANAVVRHNTAAQNQGFGITVINSRDSQVAFNEAHGNAGYGLHLGGTNLTVVGNNASNNERGINVICCEGYHLSVNRAWSNLQDGIRTVGINATVSGNHVWSNGRYGIFVEFAAGHTLTANNIPNNAVGIYVSLSSNVVIYRNDLVDNALQAVDDRGPENSWAAGYPTGGNYWSDHPAVDQCSGPDQGFCPDADGFADTPYGIDGDSRDPYPLMSLVDSNNTFPVASFSYLPDFGSETTEFTFDASSSQDAEDPLEALEFRWDWDGDWAWDTNWATETTTLHQYGVSGDHTARLLVRDSGGLLNATTRRVRVDGEPPTTTAALSGTMGQNGWFRSSVSVALSATDGVSGVESTEYRVDDGPWLMYTAPFGVSAEGTHTIDYRSKDNVGNLESVQTTIVRVDTRAPHTAVAVNGTLGENGWFVSGVNVTLTPSDATSGLAGTIYRGNGGNWTNYTAPFAIDVDGVTLLELYSTDVAGNVEPLQEVEVKIDREPPGLTFLSPEAASWQSQSNLAVLWKGSDQASGVDRYEVAVDGGLLQTLTEGRLELVGLTEGPHSVQVVVYDRAGHFASFVHSFNVDTEPPGVTITAPSPQSHHVQTLIVIRWDASDTSGVAACFLSWDGGNEISPGSVSSYEVELADGPHEVTVRCIDRAGNSGEATLSLSVDTDLFSPAGPYGPWLLITLIAIPAASGAGTLAWYWRRLKAKRPPGASE